MIKNPSAQTTGLKSSSHLLDDLQTAESPVKVAHRVSEKVIEWDGNLMDMERSRQYSTYLEIIEEFGSYCDRHEIRLDFPALSNHRMRNIHRIMEFFWDVKSGIEKQTPKGPKAPVKRRQPVESLFLPGLTLSGSQIIQKKINEIRDLIRQSRELTNGAKCLRKLEAFQRELNKSGENRISLKDFIN